MDKNDKKAGKDKWLTVYAQLTALEFIVSVIFLALAYSGGNSYFRGVGVGLLIAWVTGVLAYFVVKGRA
jgi:hypothetical protein